MSIKEILMYLAILAFVIGLGYLLITGFWSKPLTQLWAEDEAKEKAMQREAVQERPEGRYDKRHDDAPDDTPDILHLPRR